VDEEIRDVTETEREKERERVREERDENGMSIAIKREDTGKRDVVNESDMNSLRLSSREGSERCDFEFP